MIFTRQRDRAAVVCPWVPLAEPEEDSRRDFAAVADTVDMDFAAVVAA